MQNWKKEPCNECEMFRSRPNTLDRFIDELKDTKAYCDYYKAEVEELGNHCCNYFKRLPYYYRRYPIKTCHSCGEYVRDYNDELYDENIICGKCRWK